MTSAEPQIGSPRSRLSLLDSTSIIVGIVIGAGIYETTPLIAGASGGPAAMIAVWLAGGLLSLIGALCYAELATAYPREGGDYVYVTRAFGSRAGFLLAWAWFWIVRPGNIGAMAFVFARYAQTLLPPGFRRHDGLYAGGAVAVLTLINILNVRGAAWTQNLLTLAKVGGLAAVAIIGVFFSAPAAPPSTPPGPDPSLAMILVLFAYGGWTDMSYVAAEVRDPRRNILRALVLGTAAVTAIYLAVNAAFLHALGFRGVTAAGAIASQVASLAVGPRGGAFIGTLICVSCLGAIHGMILTGSRVYYAVGTDHRFFGWLGHWNERWGTPVRSLVLQAMVTAGLIAALAGEDGFGRMVTFTAPLFWFFMFLVGASLFVLRRTDTRPRSFTVPGYPVTPLLFCASSLYMFWAGARYAMLNPSPEAAWTMGAMAVGLPLCLLVTGRGSNEPADAPTSKPAS